jgi:hypothetical protein
VAKTGWNYTTIAGGPDPRQDNGAIRTVTYHAGRSVDGQRFGGVVDNYHERVVVPFQMFCHTAFREYFTQAEYEQDY